MIDSERHLKYGDKIILKNKKNNIVLGSRGLDTHSAYYIKCTDESFIENIYLFPNVFDLIFEIHPQLNYEAAKEFEELKPEDPNYKVSQKRMKLEENLNKTKLVENKDRPIYLGSIVQFFHVATRTYLQINPQKITNTEMGVIGSSLKTSEKAQFQLSLPFSFYRKGTPVNYDNSFILQDASKKCLAFPVKSSEWEKIEMKFVIPVREGFNWWRNVSTEVNYEVPFIIENQKYFRGFEAGYVSMGDVSSETYGNDFQAINVSSFMNKKEGIVLWGNSLNIRRMENSNGKASMMVSEVNEASTKNQILYRQIDDIEPKRIKSIESCFQILPLTNSQVGSTIKYDQFKRVYCLIKCSLSGKYFKENPITRAICLCEDYETEKQFIINNKYKIEEDFLQRMAMYKERPHREQDFSQFDLDRFSSTKKEHFKTEKDFYIEHKRQMVFRLVKMSSDDDTFVNTSNFFKIIAPSNRCLRVMDQNPVISVPTEDPQKKVLRDFQANSLSKFIKDFPVETASSQDFDLFYFQESSQVYEIYLSRITRLLPALCHVLHSFKSNSQNLNEYFDTVRNLKQTFVDIVGEGELARYEVQNLFRQASVVDLLMQFLVLAVENSSSADVGSSSVLQDVCQESILMIEMLIRGNKVNSLYVYQWRQFMSHTILGIQDNILTRSPLTNTFFSVIDNLQYYHVYADSFIGPLCSKIKFNKFEGYKIDILIKIIASFLKGNDEKSLETIFKHIFTKNNQDEIFKGFVKRGDTNLQVEMGSVIIDEHVQQEYNTYNYIIKVIKLSIILCEIDLLKVSKKMSEIFPKEECMILIDNSSLPNELRCLILNLHSSVYILSQVYHHKVIKFENLILVPDEFAAVGFGRLLDTGKTDGTMSGKKLNAALGKEDIAEITVNADNKNHLNKFIAESTDNKAILYSSLKIIIQLIDTNFFVLDEIKDIKEKIEHIIIKETENKYLLRSNTNRINNLVANMVEDQLNSDNPFSEFGKPENFITVNDNEEDEEIHYANTIIDHKDELSLVNLEEGLETRKSRYDYLVQILDIMMSIYKIILTSTLKESLVNSTSHSHGTDEAKRAKYLDERQKKVQKSAKKAIESSKYGTSLLIQSIVEKDVGRVTDLNTLSKLVSDLNIMNNKVVSTIGFKWLNTSAPDVFCKVLEYYRSVARHKFTLYETNRKFYLIDKAEYAIEYNYHRRLTAQMLKVIRNISKDYSFERLESTSSQIAKIYELLVHEFEYLYKPITKEEKLNMKENSMKDPFVKRSTTVNFKDSIDLDNPQLSCNILNLFLIKLRGIPIRQKIMLKSGFIIVLMEVLNFFNNKLFAKNVDLRSADLESRNLFDKTEFKQDQNSYNQLNATILFILYYCIFNNTNISIYLTTDHQEEIFTLLINQLKSKEPFLKKISLMILNNLIGNHIDIIYSLTKRLKPYFMSILDQYIKEVVELNYEVMMNYIELFKSASCLNNIIFEKNFDLIHTAMTGENSGRGKTVNIYKIINDEVKNSSAKLLQKGGLRASSYKKDLKSERRTLMKELKDEQNDKELERLNLNYDIDENDNLYSVVDVPGIMMYSNELMRFYSHVGLFSSIDTIVNICKLLSLDSIISTFESTKEIWFMKSTILEFLSTLVLNNRLDIKGKSLIIGFVKDILMKDMNDYFNIKGLSQYSRNILMVSNYTKVRPLYIKSDSDLDFPYYNAFTFEYNETLHHYIKVSTVEFVKEFGMVCYYDLNANIIDSLIDIVNDIYTKSPNKAILNAFNIPTKNGGFEEKNFDFEDKVERIQLGEVRDKNEKHKLLKMSTLDDKKTQLLEIIQNLFESDPHDNKYSFILNTEADTMNKSIIIKKIQAEFANDEEKLKIHLKEEYNIEFQKMCSELKVELLSTMVSSKSTGFSNYLRMCSVILANQKVESKFISLVLKYLKNQIIIEKEKKEFIIESLIDYSIVGNIIGLIKQRNKDKEIMIRVFTFLNCLLETGNVRLQETLVEELDKDIDNTVANVLLRYLTESFNNYIEIENIRQQVQEDSRVKYLKEEISMRIENKINIQIEHFIKILEVLRLMCENHFIKLQNYMRQQTIGDTNIIRNNQVNFIEVTIAMFKSYIKYTREDNKIICITILRYLIELVQGPCSENQSDMIKKKLLEPLEDFHTNLIYCSYNMDQNSRIEIINLIIILKLGILESNKDIVVVKSLAGSLNLELVWMRIVMIYCDLFNIKTKVSISQDVSDKGFSRDNSINPLSSPLKTRNLRQKSNLESAKQLKKEKIKSRMIKSEYSKDIIEALHSLILLNQLSNHDKEIDKMIEMSFKRMVSVDKVVTRARKFFNDRIQSIEFVDDEKNLQNMYFYIHPKTEFLSNVSIFKFERDVNRKNWTTKISDLMNFIPRAYLEIQHNYRLYKIFGINISISYFYILKVFNFVLSIVINFLLLSNPDFPDEVIDKQVFRSWEAADVTERVTIVLCFILLGTTSLSLALYIVYEFIVKMKIFWMERRKEEIAYGHLHGVEPKQQSFYRLSRFFHFFFRIFLQTKILLVMGLVACCVLGLTVSKMYFSLLLLDIIEISPILLNVIKSISLNFLSLSTTGLFIVIMSFIYSSIAYYNGPIRNNLVPNDQQDFVVCGTFPTCFWNTLNLGIKSGGGLGDIMQIPETEDSTSDYLYRTFFDVVFFVTMILILLNIILGIIIDSFAELRDLRLQIGSYECNV